VQEFNVTFGSLVSLALGAVRSPREVASTVLSVGVPPAALLPAFLLVVILSVLLTVVGQNLGVQPSDGGGSLSPLAVTALLCALLGAYIFGLYRTGQAMGGTGSLAETALLMVFLQFILLLAQVVELLLWVAAPPLAGIFVIAVAVLAFWININFVDVLHGYGSLLKSFGLIVMVSLGIALVVMLLLTLSGVTLQGTG
jgi:hypothetical protein